MIIIADVCRILIIFIAFKWRLQIPVELGEHVSQQVISAQAREIPQKDPPVVT